MIGGFKSMQPINPIPSLSPISPAFQNAAQQVVTILFHEKVNQEETKKLPLRKGRIGFQTEKTNESKNHSSEK